MYFVGIEVHIVYVDYNALWGLRCCELLNLEIFKIYISLYIPYLICSYDS